MARYFPGLNGLRVYAAFSVIGFHAGPGLLKPFLLDGRDAVTLFFVLSGFLITYILLNEQGSTGTINLRRFYWRRTLRIFPVYYVGYLFGTVLVPLAFGHSTCPPIALFGLATFTTNLFPFELGFGAMWHYWSLGVEEQFYLFWSPLLKRFNVIAVIIGVFVVKLVLFFLVTDPHGQVVLDNTRFECMAIGGLAAWMVYTRHSALQLIYSRVFQWTAVAIIGLFAVVDQSIAGWVFSVPAAILIVNVATNPKALLVRVLEWRPLRTLGDWTYSAYIYHYPLQFALKSVVPSAYMLPVLAISAFAFAGLSYRWFEKPLLGLKDYSPKPPILPRVDAP
ncbi:MAG: acyltransferase [Anaerolineae bacterium]|nr:acyltransferase [Anaerolineae bacterium]